MTTWRDFACLLVELPQSINDDLLRRGGISLTDYTVLIRLSEAPDRALRMGDLASGASISPSRMRRIVASMVDRGFVDRRASPGDARVNVAVLTDAGPSRLQQAWPAHLAGVRALVVDRLTDEDLADLRRISDKLLPGPND